VEGLQEQMFSTLEEQSAVVAGDGQMDSPGFCAKNCVYTLMHEDLNYVPGNFLRIRQWGGHLQKGTYYTQCGEIIDGLLVTKRLVWYRI
jgi:hypothetical protein